jgi:hypothetical protein
MIYRLPFEMTRFGLFPDAESSNPFHAYVSRRGAQKRYKRREDITLEIRTQRNDHRIEESRYSSVYFSSGKMHDTYHDNQLEFQSQQLMAIIHHVMREKEQGCHETSLLPSFDSSVAK